QQGGTQVGGITARGGTRQRQRIESADREQLLRLQGQIQAGQRQQAEYPPIAALGDECLRQWGGQARECVRVARQLGAEAERALREVVAEATSLSQQRV